MIMHNDWDQLFDQEIQKDYLQNLRYFLAKEYKTKNIYPAKENIFAAFFTMFTELSFAFSEKCVMMRAHKNMEVQYYGLCYWRRLCQLRYLR